VTKPPRELIEFLFRYESAVQSLALGLRTVVTSEMAPCHEYIFAMRFKVVLLYGPSERVIKDAVCMVSVHRSHVNLTFARGAELPDKARILRGTGTSMRHITLRTLADLDRPELRQYIREARRHAGLRRPRGNTVREVVTRVKPPSQKSWFSGFRSGRSRPPVPRA
jgi:hypothetical protein